MYRIDEYNAIDDFVSIGKNGRQTEAKVTDTFKNVNTNTVVYVNARNTTNTRFKISIRPKRLCPSLAKVSKNATNIMIVGLVGVGKRRVVQKKFCPKKNPGPKL